MSAIDCFANVPLCVMRPQRIPLYFLVSDFDKNAIIYSYENKMKDILPKMKYVSLGGGSGEREALIFNIDSAVFQYFNLVSDILEQNEIECQLIEDFDLFVEQDETDVRYHRLDLNVLDIEIILEYADLLKTFGFHQSYNSSLNMTFLALIGYYVLNHLPIKVFDKSIQGLIEKYKKYMKDCDDQEIKGFIQSIEETFDIAFISVENSEFYKACGAKPIYSKFNEPDGSTFGYTLEMWKEDHPEYID